MAKKGNPVVATAYLYHSAMILADMAEVLGIKDDAKEYREYASNVRRVYNRYLIGEDGTIIPGRQAPYVRVLEFGLADEENLPKIREKLAEAVRDNDFCLNTGFLSTPYLLKQLCDAGYPDCAYKVLEQTGNPSWLHAITLGATTTLESWDGIDRYCNSFNHYSYGAAADFLFTYAAGIQPVKEAPGYRRFRIHPVTGGSLTSASAEMDTPCGIIVSAWEKTENGFTCHFTVPADTKAEVVLPAAHADTETLARDFGAATENGEVRFTTGSGDYIFRQKA